MIDASDQSVIEALILPIIHQYKEMVEVGKVVQSNPLAPHLSCYYFKTTMGFLKSQTLTGCTFIEHLSIQPNEIEVSCRKDVPGIHEERNTYLSVIKQNT